MKNKHVILGNIIHFTVDGKMYTVQNKHLRFTKIKELLIKGAYEEALKESKEKGLETKALKIVGDKITVKSGNVTLGEAFVDAYLYAREGGKTQEAILDLFMENVAKNPDPVSRDGLNAFIAHSKMPITDRGTFLAYRYVNDRLFDCHTNTMDNMIGKSIEMDRRKCDSNPHADCSRGLHVCHHGYLGSSSYGRYDLVVEINPRDVVAVPARYDARKMRVCRFRPLCTLKYFKQQLRIAEQAALGGIPVFMTEQTRAWDCTTGVPKHLLEGRYDPVDAWKWAKG